ATEHVCGDDEVAESAARRLEDPRNPAPDPFVTAFGGKLGPRFEGRGLWNGRLTVRSGASTGRRFTSSRHRGGVGRGDMNAEADRGRIGARLEGGSFLAGGRLPGCPCDGPGVSGGQGSARRLAGLFTVPCGPT